MMKKILNHTNYSLLILGLLCTAVSAGERLKNADFARGLTGWSFHVHKSMKVKRTAKQGILTVEVAKASSPQHVQLIQKFTLQEGQQYKLAFDAKREGPAVKTQVVCSQQSRPFKSYGLNKTVTFSDQWSRHELTFTAKGVVLTNKPTLRIYLGNQLGTVQLRNFSLTDASKAHATKTKKKTMAQKTSGVKKRGQTALRIIPQPKQLTTHKGTFQLGQTLFIQSNSPQATRLFKQEVTFITGKKEDTYQVAERTSKQFFLAAANTADVDLFDEIKAAPHHQGGYALSILPQGIAIKGHDEEGLRNGIQSFLQVLEQSENETLPQLTIRDLPDLKFRAMHLVLRAPGHWGKKNAEEVQDIYRWIFRRLGRYKYTHVCIMIKGNVELKKHPEMWPKTAYSQDELKAIIKIGQEQGLSVFPEFKTLGKFFFSQSKKTLNAHADMINRKIKTHSKGSWKTIFHESWSGQRLNAEQKAVKGDGSLSFGLDIANPKVLPMMLDCLDEIYELFDQPKLFSLGMDEAHFFGTAWPKEVNRGKMLADYANALNRHLKKKGCRTIMWGDMLLNHLQFPYFFENHGGPPLNTFEAVPLLDKDIIIADWHYGYTVGEVFPEHYPSISWFRQNGLDVIAVPWFIQSNMANLARDVAATSSKGIMGSSWALHMTYALHTRKNAFQKRPRARKTTEERRELGIFASTAEAAWTILKAKKIMKQYDSVEWEKRWLPRESQN